MKVNLKGKETLKIGVGSYVTRGQGQVGILVIDKHPEFDKTITSVPVDTMHDVVIEFDTPGIAIFTAMSILQMAASNSEWAENNEA